MQKKRDPSNSFLIMQCVETAILPVSEKNMINCKLRGKTKALGKGCQLATYKHSLVDKGLVKRKAGNYCEMLAKAVDRSDELKHDFFSSMTSLLVITQPARPFRLYL